MDRSIHCMQDVLLFSLSVFHVATALLVQHACSFSERYLMLALLAF